MFQQQYGQHLSYLFSTSVICTCPTVIYFNNKIGTQWKIGTVLCQVAAHSWPILNFQVSALIRKTICCWGLIIFFPENKPGRLRLP